MSHWFTRGCIISLVAASMSTLASAETEAPPRLEFTFGIGGHLHSWSDPWGTPAGGSLWGYNSAYSIPGARFSYAMEVDPDPIIGFDLMFVNETSSTQTFFAMVSLPVTPFAGPTRIGATISGSVTDADLDGVARVASAGEQGVLTGVIDGVAWLSLLKAPFEVEVSEIGGTEFIGPDSDGMPGATLDGPIGASTYIGVTLQFKLSAGDTASFSGAFVVEYVPAPSAAIALLGLLFTRRRRV